MQAYFELDEEVQGAWRVIVVSSSTGHELSVGADRKYCHDCCSVQDDLQGLVFRSEYVITQIPIQMPESSGKSNLMRDLQA